MDNKFDTNFKFDMRDYLRTYCQDVLKRVKKPQTEDQFIEAVMTLLKTGDFDTFEKDFGYVYSEETMKNLRQAYTSVKSFADLIEDEEKKKKYIWIVD